MNSLAEVQTNSEPLVNHLDTAPGVSQISPLPSVSTTDPQSTSPSQDVARPQTNLTISPTSSNHVLDGVTISNPQQVILGAAEEAGAVGSQRDRVASQEDKEGLEEPEIGPQPAVQHVKEEGEVSLEQSKEQLELLEQTPDGLMGTEDGSGIITEDGQEWIPDADHELKRVKVYELVGARWVDQGTAFCFGQLSDDSNDALLIARSERNYNHVILSTSIRSNDVYQRQQETLIVWTEPDGVDYALSFQDPEGCAEVWNFILDVQRHMNSADNLSNISSSPLLGPETSVTTASIIRSGHLPQPELGIIGEIERAIKALARTQLMKERICEYIQHEDYIKSLIDVMNTAEDVESLENLHALCSLMQTILMLNDHSMYEHILEDDIFFGVVGMLEYDPDFPGHKANYREFLHQQSQFHQPIPIRDISVQRKIHHTYRLQFLKDVVLARALDDSTFNVLNSCIIFNQIDIIQHVQVDPNFLLDIVSLFVDERVVPTVSKKQGAQCPPTQGSQQAHIPSNQIIISLNGNRGDPDNDMDVDPKPEECVRSVNPAVSNNPSLRQYYQTHYAYSPPDNLTDAEINLRREVIILIQQLCVMGKNVQLPARMALFRTLVDRGILYAVHWALSLPEKEEANKSMISAAGEVLSALLDHDVNGVRGHCLKHVEGMIKERTARKKYADKAESLLELLCRLMATSRDLAVQSQVGDALKTWLEIPPGGDLGAPGAGAPPEAAGPPKVPVRKDGDVTERFIDFLYKNCLHILFKPLMELSEWRNVQEPILPLYREEANRFTYLADLLHTFIAQHQFQSHFYVVSSNIIARVASLLKAKDKHLRHAAFRIFRLLLKQGNPTTHNHMCKLDVFKPILDLTLQESRRDNLLSCSCQEFFDSMRRDNLKDMIKFCMTNHEEEIRKLAKTPLGSQRFELFIKRYEINCEPPPDPNKSDNKLVDPRTWTGPGRGMLDVEEEDYFHGDDNEDDDNVLSVNHQWTKIAPPVLSGPPISGLKRKRRAGLATKGHRPPLRSPVLGSLLDYDDEEDEPGTPGSESPEASSSKLSPATPGAPSPPGSSRASSSPPPRPPQGEEDEEDRLLEALVSQPRSRPQTPAPGSMRPGGKRRRDEDEDEDELLERLRKSKKPDLGGSAAPKRGSPVALNRSRTGNDPPKKIKVNLGASSLSLASNQVAPDPLTSHPGVKDGDTG